MQLKYIRTKSGFIVWPDMTLVFHKHMAALVKEEVISAGFCIFIPYEARFICYGESDSLQMKSKLEDSSLMTAFFSKSSPL